MSGRRSGLTALAAALAGARRAPGHARPRAARRVPGHARRLAALACVLCALLAADALEAQGRPGRRGGTRSAGPEGVTAGLDLRRHDFGAVAVSAHPWSTVVAITVAFPSGSAADPGGAWGAAWLLGATVRDEVAEPLSELGARVHVEVGRSATVFQLLAPPSRWHEAWEVLTEHLFGATLDHPTLDERRDELRAVFAFESGAPTRDFQREFASLVGDRAEAWSRDPRGTSESVARIDDGDLGDLRRRIYRREAAIVTVVGALQAEPGVAVHPGAGRDGDDLRGWSDGGRAWDRGRRERVTREVTNGLIGAAFPARGDAPRTALEFVAHQLELLLNPVPRDPGLFGEAEVRLEDHPEGPLVVVEAAVLPEDQERWEGRIEDAFDALAERYRDASFLTLHRQHFRNVRLLEQSVPEAEGRRIALDLLRHGRVRDLAAELSSLTAEQVVRAIESLGEPRMLVYGPRLGG